MARVRFLRKGQSKFLEDIMKHTGFNAEQISKICNVCSRTFRDWKREKYNMSYEALSKLCKVLHFPMPEDIKILPDFWSVSKAGRLGGKRHFELYGAPGNKESRRKGGLNSSRKFRLNPEWAKEKGFVIRKEIRYPAKSSLLAEFIGIMIGDGTVRNEYQIGISFNGKLDQHYSIHIQLIVKNLFDISSVRYIRSEVGAADVVVTGKNLVEFLQKIGIKKGNKVVNQIDIPDWIFECREYQAACLRGLFDTDGCVYKHVYTINGKKYSYTKMCFRNYSLPVLLSFKKILENLSFSPKIDKRQQSVSLYSPSEVCRYFSEIGSSNPRYLERYNRFVVTPIDTIG